MGGRIVGLVCCLLCSFPFFVISVYNKDSREPISFWSGDTSLKDKVKDIKGYNMEIVLLLVGCPVGIYLAYRVYKRILKRYSKQYID